MPRWPARRPPRPTWRRREPNWPRSRKPPRSVQRLHNNNSSKPSPRLDPNLDPKVAKLAHDSAVADAQLAVQTAQDKLNKLKQPPADYDVQTAQQKLANAQDALTVANARFASLGQPADQFALDAA